MAALAKRRYTLAEYLEIEKHAEERYVYCGGEVVAMSGASLRHNRIVRNLMRAIDARLEGKPCEVLPTDMRIKVPKALPYRYADLVVVCGEPVIEDMQGLEVLVNPLIIFEVLSAQYFSQKSGSRLGNSAIVTKLFVLGAGFFQAVPLG